MFSGLLKFVLVLYSVHRHSSTYVICKPKCHFILNIGLFEDPRIVVVLMSK